MMLTIGDVRDAAGLYALEPEWRALEARDPHATPFQSWDWIATWWKYLGTGTPLILTARDAGGQLVGLLPLHVGRYRGLPLRRVTFMAAPLSDYQDQLAEPEHAAACGRLFWAWLVARAGEWDLIDLPDVRPGSALGAGPADLGQRVVISHHRFCPAIGLPGTWDAYRAGLGKHQRSALPRQRRQLERAHATVFERADADEDLVPTLEALFALHNSRWQARGLAGAFSSERVRAFHHEVAPRLRDSGVLRLHRLRVDGRIAGVYYGFSRHGHVYYYLSGFQDALARFSPGRLLVADAIAGAISEGARVFDFLRGNEHYKYEWKAADAYTVRLVLKNASLRSAVAVGLNRAERSLEQLGTRLRNRLWGRHASRKRAA